MDTFTNHDCGAILILAYETDYTKIHILDSAGHVHCLRAVRRNVRIRHLHRTDTVSASTWRWEWIGTAGTIALGIAYVVLTRGEEHWSAYVVIVAPLVIIGMLFFIGWRIRTSGRVHNELEDN